MQAVILKSPVGRVRKIFLTHNLKHTEINQLEAKATSLNMTIEVVPVAEMPYVLEEILLEIESD